MAREKGMGNLQREKSGRWTMRVGLNGKRYSRSTRTKDRDQAERVLQRFLAPLGLGEHRLPLADVWLEYVRSPNRNELSKATLESKRQVWMQFAKWMEHFYLPVKDLGGVTADMVGEYLACIRSELCATTYNNRVCVLREIFRALAVKAGLQDDPWEGVRLRPDDSHSRRELTMQELKRLLAVAEGEWRALILIGIYTGLRLGDCCRLDWSRVNVAEGVIQLVPEKTKRHHKRMVTIPVHPTLGQELIALSQESRGNTGMQNEGVSSDESTSINTHSSPFVTGPVLPVISQKYSTGRWQVSHMLKRIFKAANITTSVRIEGRKHKTPEATFHSLRHTFVSFAANAGVPLHVVQSIVGHESTAMTRHYYHENLDALKSAVAAIPAL